MIRFLVSARKNTLKASMHPRMLKEVVLVIRLNKKQTTVAKNHHDSLPPFSSSFLK
jgi:hypothetical protein